MKIVADDKILYIKGALEPYADVVYKEGKAITAEDVKDADALLVRTRTKCNGELLSGSSVQMVATATIGTDHLDTTWLEGAGIEWANAPGCNSGSVRQYIASILSHLILDGVNPANTTLGIVGVGMVGSKVAQLAGALGFKVLLNDPPRARREGADLFTPLHDLLKQSDIVTFHTPLNMAGPDKSFHLLDSSTVKLLKKGAVVINSSRGEVTQTEALLHGLEQGIISRLVLDVWENEPNINPVLHGRVWFGTPHIAGYSADGKANGSTMAVQAVSRKLNLPTVNWQPSHVPMPDNTTIPAPNSIDTPLQMVAQAILETYDIADDSERLRRTPDLFEQLRGSYPVRREFQLWKVETRHNYPAAALRLFKDLGFQLV
ncbi:4-phosphoerythronate dehydrogenase [Geofilum sp. OHC36d9]|uniref:4-phosphoerythronate dehydrogenase n=1 Tax=Geofilum sp. OHC36d9 TaxID=3458413 RepID=UPI00403397CD